jgi:hypothetical protein
MLPDAIAARHPLSTFIVNRLWEAMIYVVWETNQTISNLENFYRLRFVPP